MNYSAMTSFLSGLAPIERLTCDQWADKYRYLTTESSAEPGLWRTDRTPFLREILQCLSPTSEINEVVVAKGVQLGFALDVNTPIFTINGWVKMADIKVGDIVFDENGIPCDVTFVTDQMHDHLCYDVVFSDGSIIKADADHKWEVWDEKRWGSRKKVIISTANIFSSFKTKRGNNRYAIDVCGPIMLPEKDLPIPPYTFGCWLGDGNSWSNRITTHADDIDEMASYMTKEGARVEVVDGTQNGNCKEILLWPICKEMCKRGHIYKDTGYYIKKDGKRTCAECARQTSKQFQYGYIPDKILDNYKFGYEIRKLGVFSDKYIPDLYLTSSLEHRLDLLSGLMDTDGHVTKEGYCEFYSISDKLIRTVFDLICSVGYKPVLNKKKQSLTCKIGENKQYNTKGYVYRITFHAFLDRPVCKLLRKKNRLRKKEDCRHSEISRRRIVDVKLCESVPVKCISVNSKSHLYLAGRSMIPTHNTESGLNCVGTYIDIDPCPIMYVMPTINLAEAVSKDRVTPMIDNCPSLKAKVSPGISRNSGNTISVKQFPGGRLVLAGANSAASLRSRPCRVLIFDEVDAAPLDVDGEGSPVSLAEKRTSTFGDRRKIYKLSTPTIEGKSVIWKEYLNTDQRKYMVPCPHCGLMQELFFENLRWEKNKYNNTTYMCAGCDKHIEEKHKTEMLLNGYWQPQAESTNKNKRGYHINSLYSPVGWLSWNKIAEEYDKSEVDNDDFLRKTFVNTILGLPYSEKGDSPPWENLYNRREPYKINSVPNEVCFISAGADIQKNRIEVEIVGWTKGKRSYSIDYRVFSGETSDIAVWNQLGAVVNEAWTREDGLVLPLKMMCVDSGYNSQFVYDFCRRFDPSRVVPIKGQDKQQIIISSPKHVDVSPNGKVGRILIWHVGVSLLKSELYGWLKSEKNHDTGEYPNGYCHFPEYGPDYFKGLTAERLESKKVKGALTYGWFQHYDRNEPLDCRIYARAAAAIIGIDRFEDRHYDAMAGVYRKKKTKTKEDDYLW